MGAVQRLALVVIIGLTALATLLVIYLADEPNRRGAEAQEQTEASLERAMATYNQFCVSCHGPGGRGYLESGRIGFPLAGTYVGP
ncbi:MAG: c-type cytochrome [Thermomicrobiales bacterium]